MREKRVTEEELRIWRAVILAPNRDIVKKLRVRDEGRSME